MTHTLRYSLAIVLASLGLAACSIGADEGEEDVGIASAAISADGRYIIKFKDYSKRGGVIAAANGKANILPICRHGASKQLAQQQRRAKHQRVSSRRIRPMPRRVLPTTTFHFNQVRHQIRTIFVLYPCKYSWCFSRCCR